MSGAAPTRVLVVDDDLSTRMLMRLALERGGFAVLEAADGEQALAHCAVGVPDLVLLDVEMPGMGGFETCEALRELPDGGTLPIVMVTGRDDAASVHEAYEHGATDFIGKPINWALLGHRVRYIARVSEAYRRLHDSEMRYRALLEAMPDAILRLGADGRPRGFASELHARAHGCGAAPGELPEEFRGITRAAVERALADGGVHSHEYTLVREWGERHYEARLVSCAADEVLAIVRDVTSRKAVEQRVRYLAYYDELTGLPNRRSYAEQLERALESARRQGTRLAIMFLDLDRFKNINDTLGHSAGDALLRGVAERLSQCLRRSDLVARDGAQAPDAVARVGGDEFILLLTDTVHATDPAVVAGRIRAALAKPFDLAGHEIVVTPSIGIAMFPEDGQDAETLLKNADTAMYRAKADGRNSFSYYTGAMNARSLERLDLENDLRRALERGELLVHYQLQFDAQTHAVIGAEALLRWAHPGRGLMLPEEFIALAEETGLLTDIGQWVLETACRSAASWQRGAAAPLLIAVNVSARQLRDAGFATRVARTLEDTGLAPACLELEFTESELIRNAGDAARILHELRALGVRLALDDFGTGHSSLTCLRDFPLQTLKVDGSFVRDLEGSSRNGAILESLLSMARALQLRVVAEGVETRGQLDFLRARGCTVIQGFLLDRPGPIESTELPLGCGTAAAG